jgi:hypothetical protein
VFLDYIIEAQNKVIPDTKTNSKGYFRLFARWLFKIFFFQSATKIKLFFLKFIDFSLTKKLPTFRSRKSIMFEHKLNPSNFKNYLDLPIFFDLTHLFHLS